MALFLQINKISRVALIIFAVYMIYRALLYSVTWIFRKKPDVSIKYTCGDLYCPKVACDSRDKTQCAIYDSIITCTKRCRNQCVTSGGNIQATVKNPKDFTLYKQYRFYCPRTNEEEIIQQLSKDMYLVRFTDFFMISLMIVFAAVSVLRSYVGKVRQQARRVQSLAIE